MTEQASCLLGDVVRFIRPPEGGPPIRAIVGQRWASSSEWAFLRRRGLAVAEVMEPPPERSRREQACPCPACGRCCCRFVGLGHKNCRRAEPCVCPRARPPLRLDFRRVNMERGELVLARNGAVLCTLGTWTRRGDWDFSLAGDAKSKHLRLVIEAVMRRHGTALALRTVGLCEARAAA
jgi:hypothetical protein